MCKTKEKTGRTSDVFPGFAKTIYYGFYNSESVTGNSNW